jgi:hypothetical protein
LLLDHKRPVYRSRGLYPNQGGNDAFGSPFAFADWGR